MSPIRSSEVNGLVRREGEKIRHLVGLPCFCIDEHGNLSPSCREHDFSGHIYENERPIIALIGGMTNHKHLLEAGIALPSDCVCSPLTGDVVSVGDKVIFTWPEPFGEGEPLIRGAEDADRLIYEAVKAIYCVDEDRTYYKQGRDFRFVDKTIEWTWAGKPAEGKSPALGVKYSLKYSGYLEYIAFELPMERVSAGKDIGSKVLLRRLHLAGG